MKALFAQRELTYLDDSGRERGFHVRVGAPRADAGAWACDYEIGAPEPLTATAYGEDSLQVLALHAVQAHLDAPDLRGRVRWLGGPVAGAWILELGPLGGPAAG